MLYKADRLTTNIAEQQKLNPFNDLIQGVVYNTVIDYLIKLFN